MVEEDMEASELYKDRVNTIDEVAAIFRVPANTVRRLILRGDLPAIRLGRVYRVPVSVIDRYFDLPEPTLSAEDLGLGMRTDDSDIGDSVEYVNRIRAAGKRPLQEVLDELAHWRQ
jgi:excisionase family DNA binding protein